PVRRAACRAGRTRPAAPADPRRPRLAHLRDPATARRPDPPGRAGHPAGGARDRDLGALRAVAPPALRRGGERAAAGRAARRRPGRRPAALAADASLADRRRRRPGVRAVARTGGWPGAAGLTGR